jgi:hypothetical protein
LDSASGRLAAGIAVGVVGADGTPHAGVEGTGYCLTLHAADPALRERVAALLERRRGFSHPQVLSALEVGFASSIAYVVEPAARGESLGAKLTRSGPAQPWVVAPVISQIASALGAIHAAGLSHGQLHPGTVWLDVDDGSVQIGALGMGGRGPRHDVELLAALTFELLTGERWTRPTAERELDLTGLVRDQLPSLSERVAAALALGLSATTSGALSGPTAFSQELDRALDGSAAELVGGAFDALNAGNPAMATLLADAAAKYAPNSEDLTVLRYRMTGSSPERLAAAPAMTSLTPAVPIPPPPATHPAAPPPPVDLNPQIVALLAGVTPAEPKTGANPWILFAVGLFFCIIVLTVVGALTFSAS